MFQCYKCDNMCLCYFYYRGHCDVYSDVVRSIIYIDARSRRAACSLPGRPSHSQCEEAQLLLLIQTRIYPTEKSKGKIIYNKSYLNQLTNLYLCSNISFTKFFFHFQ